MAAFCLAFLVNVLLVGCARRDMPLQNERYLVGAHYYLWYPRNFRQGFLRNELVPPQAPLLGLYDSADADVVEQHIAWCSRYGIDFLTVDWWPYREESNRRLDDSFLQARNIDDIRFCIFYEAWSLGFNKIWGNTEFGDKESRKMSEDMLHLASRYFDHPSYLKINERPVVIFYLSRTFSGDFIRAIKQVRRELKKKGYDPFFIGDEIFWNVTPVVKQGEKPYPLTEEPQVRRIRCFDAITAYNMYENENATQGGYGSESTYMEDVARKFDEYRAAAPRGTGFIPSVIPGYNDRALRKVRHHAVIPRRWSSGAPEGSFFAHSLERLALPYLDPSLNMFLITSWNEWNEDTAIEPVAPAAPTNLDRSKTQTAYTDGYTYTGYGLRFLEILRDSVVAVCGRVTDKEGRGIRGSRILVIQGIRTNRAVSDHQGFYRVTRLGFEPGTCQVICAESGQKRIVDVSASMAITGVCFTSSSERFPDIGKCFQ